MEDPLVGQLIDGRWKILSRLGAGGMGVVYRAERLKIFKLVALKFLEERFAQSSEAVARFERETRAISRLQHRHVVSILDFGVHERRPYIVMEYLAGVPLSKEVGGPRMTPRRAVAIVSQMLEALRHAHKAGVIHRDLKPENVMLVETTGTEDFVKILDFGLARIISLDEPSISAEHLVAGTPGFMSPDQIRGLKIDHRTDIYSMGIILYALCVGRKPFQAKDDLDVLRMHLNAEPVPPRKAAPDKKISSALERVILRAVEKDRDRRYFSAEEMVKALKATPESGGVVKQRRSGRAAALVVLGMGVGAGVYFWPRPQQQPPPVLAPPALPPPPEPATPSPVLAPPVSVEPSPSPTEAPAPTPVELPPPTLEQKIQSMIETEKFADAERLLRAQAILEPKAGWVHLELGDLYFRRLWRKDVIVEWSEALKLDPSLRRDPRLVSRLCSMLSAGWKGAGERFIVASVGKAALGPLEECSGNDPAAMRLRERLRKH
jgi:serine/threonine-protein kinase